MIRKLLQHILPRIIRPLHTLWNQVIGFLFLCLAALAVPSVIRFWRTSDLVRMSVTLAFVVLMASYGVFSFLRARKISRS